MDSMCVHTQILTTTSVCSLCLPSLMVNGTLKPLSHGTEVISLDVLSLLRALRNSSYKNAQIIYDRSFASKISPLFVLYSDETCR